MKTTELIDELYEIDYVGKCYVDESVLYVLDNKNNVIASVDYLTLGVLETRFTLFIWLKGYETTRLLRLLFLYASTPLDERLDEDGY